MGRRRKLGVWHNYQEHKIGVQVVRKILRENQHPISNKIDKESKIQYENQQL